jgi:hypothetical protein
MLGFVLDGAHWLDAWLKEHLGRLYNLVLGAGLGLGISAAINELQKEFGQGASDWKLGGLIAFQALLLLNQLAQLRDFRQDVRQRRAARRANRSSPRQDPPHS